jgi:hypothetical protein
MDTNTLIASQNDAFRKSIQQFQASENTPKGKVVMTQGVAARSPDFLLQLTRAVIAFDAFNESCDPHGVHEMGVIEIEDATVWFKIDLYDLNYEYGAEVPEDPDQTRRVLTMLLPSEY